LNSPASQTESDSSQPLARRLGLFDATMLVMGGIVGAGIFINPYVVAQRVHTPALVLGAWLAGGVLALMAAFIWAELADRMPRVGGQYAYLREAYHPLVAFLYGWVLLLVIQTGGMAAVTVTFSRYFLELTGLHFAEWQVAVFTLLALTIVNCLGVRAGGTLQSVLMLVKILAISLLIGAGAFFIRGAHIAWKPLLDQPVSPGFLSAFGAAMVPVVFAYGGWQTASFVAGEMKQPRRDLPRALVLGVAGVALLYTLVNYVYVRALGVPTLAATKTPASAVMRIALGPKGATIIALGIAFSTLGFLSQSVLTAPRVYFAMAEDGVFFRQLAWIHPRTRVPVVAIVGQSVWTMALVFLSYEKILGYVISMDAMFWALTAGCLFIFRRRVAAQPVFRMPGHPFTTAFFCLACAGVVANTIYKFPGDTLIGIAILAAGVPIYYIWRWISRA
jgi:basic amino acid/polyamine antiporter, APA family